MSADDEVRALHKALSGLPILDRQVALAVSIIDGEVDTMRSVAGLIAMARLMSGYLSREQRAAIVWLLLEQASEMLDAKFH